ncbi:DUF3054 domain-containing protein [Microbacterium sp. TNHR37B]|uniref:DUF3054 domain-containing protein n=1 Tax=Microbacterium sp. TNHR37B TaxID=1775956 RepID=UPI0007B1A40F|nr:DUF3054 domain-containing protein [Microbacterium sp. TNHR37B]KZE91841.1 hypothetical protein AVP41_01390 [Microbacterium sp. TNHR37B]
MSSRRQATVGATLLADAVLVIGFAAVGRASHDSDVWSGLVGTAGPFLLALAAGWLASRAWRDPVAPLRTGVVVWAVTLIGGLAVRAVSGQGVALPFILVATGTLFVVLVGWRAVARGIIARRRRPAC